MENLIYYAKHAESVKEKSKKELTRTRQRGYTLGVSAAYPHFSCGWCQESPLRRSWMTIARFGILISIAYLVSALLCPVALGQAETPVVRPASRGPATQVTTRSIPLFERSTQGKYSGHSRTQIGLLPVPYTPKSSQAQRPGGSSTEAGALGGTPDIRGLIRTVNPSVVAIRMLDTATSWPLRNFGMSQDPGVKAMGYGSGFIISRDGLILTNEHVLRNGTQIEVELLGGHKYTARVVRKDGKNDLALLKIDATDLHPVKLGNSDSVELGEWVVGIGNPYGIGQSIMIGIVSAQRRLIPGSGYPPLIQIDAAMNLGNSGGPLFNLSGEVIGITTILLWKSQGIGFATPVNVARGFIESNVRGRMRAAAVSSFAPIGPVSDQPRLLKEHFNPLDPPWKFRR
jgi:S1-C subfamily serine protease